MARFTVQATPVPPRQLPGATAYFTGRANELNSLTSLMGERTGGTLVISAICGMAGIGKTALALRWAYQVADRFPDGQLYVNLRGFGPTGSVMTRVEAIRGFLDAFAVPPELIPVSFEAQVSLYRSLMSDRRMLVVLDNARDAEHVTPLLPGNPHCLVIVTSRYRLTGLLTAYGAHLLTLDFLPAKDARQLLHELVGPERFFAEPAAVSEIVALCEGLPLALRAVAARATIHPEFPLTTLAAELRDARGELDLFAGGEPVADVRAVFSWSYRRLSRGAAELFRLLGVHQGPDVTAPAAASLAGIPVAQVRQYLTELDRAHLIGEHRPGRFTLHDLMRTYAIGLSRGEATTAEQRSAVTRMLDYYLHTAHNALQLMHPRCEPITPAEHDPVVVPDRFADLTSALAWLDAEHPVLLAAIQLASEEHPTHTWQLSRALGEFFERRGHWQDNVITNQTALTAARRHADLWGQAHAYYGLGRAYPWVQRYDDALSHLTAALRLFEELQDRSGQGRTHYQLSWLFEHQARYHDTLHHCRRALVLFTTTGDRPGHASVLCRVAFVHTKLGNHEAALGHCRQALAMCRTIGYLRGESISLGVLGYIHHNTGHHHEAITCYHSAINLYRVLGDRYHQAIMLAHLGDAHLANGDHTVARDTWQQALPILEHLGVLFDSGRGYPNAHQVRTALHQLNNR
jgi:tetratricopeptide (TPR) repeat protein